MLIFKQLQVDSRGKVNILEGVIVRNKLYEHMSNSEGYQDRNMNELINECMCMSTHTHTHTHICILFFAFKIMCFNAQEQSTRLKYAAYTDETYKTSL